MSIQTEASQDALAQLLARVRIKWEHLGASDPHWSVLADPRFRADRIAETLEEFYASGIADAELMHAAAHRQGIALPAAGTCFELGCGVGRVTLRLAAHFAKVIAADVSAQHLALARLAAKQSARGNIEWRRLEGPRSVDSLPTIDAFFSLIVLQHNPPPVMRWLLRSILDRLAPGGVGFFQLPTVGGGYTFAIEEYLAQPADEILMEMHVLPESAVQDVVRQSRCRLIEQREHDCIGHPDWVSKTFLVQKER